MHGESDVFTSMDQCMYMRRAEGQDEVMQGKVWPGQLFLGLIIITASPSNSL